MTCIQLGIPQTTLWDKRPDWTFDGADEVDPDRNLIKRTWRSHVQRKAADSEAAEKTFIIVDPSKLVNILESKFPIPVRGVPACTVIRRKRTAPTGCLRNITTPRPGKDGPILTENGNFILDTRFHYIDASLEEQLKTITGVLWKARLFINYGATIG